MYPLPKILLPTWGELTTLPMMGTRHAHLLGFYVRQASRMFEMGAGGSTLFALQVNRELSLTSIEHDPGWRMKVEKAHRNLIGSVNIGPRLRLGPYDQTFAKSGAPYDLAFIDGAADVRNEWANWAFDNLDDGGVMIWHDTERMEYVPTIQALEREGMRTLFHDGDDSYGSSPPGRVKLWIARKVLTA